MTTADDLTAAQALLTTGWQPGVTVDGSSRPVDPLDVAAVKWDLIGACVKITGRDTTRLRAMITAMRDSTGGFGIACYDLAAGRRLVDLSALITAAVVIAPSVVIADAQEKP